MARDVGTEALTGGLSACEERAGLASGLRDILELDRSGASVAATDNKAARLEGAGGKGMGRGTQDEKFWATKKPPGEPGGLIGRGEMTWCVEVNGMRQLCTSACRPINLSGVTLLSGVRRLF